MKDRIFTSMKRDKIFLSHYGTPQRFDFDPNGSGRYRQGSGGSNNQRATDLRAFATQMRKVVDPKTGKRLYSDTDIAKAWGVSSTEFRRLVSIDRNQERAANVSKAIDMFDKGMKPKEIAEKLGVPPSTVNSWLQPKVLDNAAKNTVIADILREQLKTKPYLDVGAGVGAQLNVSDIKLRTAVKMLEDEGYVLHTLKVEQATNPQKKTTMMVLTNPDVSWEEVKEHRDEIRSPMGTWVEDGKTARNIDPPVSVDSNRIFINYADTGTGNAKDGLIEIRPGVPDISLGQNHYAQVRIAVDGTHYLKGMATYSDDIPNGYDIRFNTNKNSNVPMCGSKNNSVLKPLKDEADNPFGATIRQFDYTDENGNKHQSAINLVNTDEDWNKWSKTLSSQMLSKQYAPLAKRQLDLVYKEKKDLYNDILKYPNDTIKKKLLEDLAEDCDSAAVHLKAAALPRQETKVIMPLENIKDNEVYAPTYKTGEEVVLIRYPHQGTFEIPRLIVNNNNPEGKKVLGNAQKAIGINKTVANQLSGADFDGDTVTVIPTINQNIRTSKPLKGLEGFDPKVQYAGYEGMKPVGLGPGKDGFNTQLQMGLISNLITDMTIKGASEAELCRATKHSLTVIDAEKHQLNWKQCYDDQQIAQLKEKYQGGKNRGASTIISQAKGEKAVLRRSTRTDVDPETGEKIYFTDKNAVWYDKEGKRHESHDRSTKMAEAKDAYELVSKDKETGLPAPYRIEIVYADHANRLKALANDIRKEWLKTKDERINKTAAETYKDEVASLNDKLRLAERNAPNERLANAAASKYIESCKKIKDYSKDDEKKLRSQVIEGMRAKAGALPRDQRIIKTTDREWEAIVAGALSADKTKKILQYMDTEEVLSRTVPRETRGVPAAKQARARALMNAGFTWAEAAEAVGVSETTLRKYIGGKE